MTIEKEMVPQLLRDLKIDTVVIDDALQILELRRDGKWSIRLLLLSYLLKENEFKTIKSFVDFAFSKKLEDSLYNRFEFNKMSSAMAMPEKWFSKESDDEFIPGSKNARSILSKRSDLFKKRGSKYWLNEANGSKKLALVLFVYLLKAHGIDPTMSPEILSGVSRETDRRSYEKLLLVDSNDTPTSLLHEIQDFLETCPLLAQESDLDQDTRSIIPHIQGAIMDTLQKHPNSFRKPPRKKEELILFEPIYQLSISSENNRFSIVKWLNSLDSAQKNPDVKSEEEQPSEEPLLNPVTVIGGAGSGKSCWIAQVASSVWNQSFKTDEPQEKEEWIPIILELGSVILDRTTRGDTLVYGEQREHLWFEHDEPDEISRRFLIERSLAAMLSSRKSSRYARRILNRTPWQGKRFVFLLDGWDELSSREKKEMTKYIESCRFNLVPCIVTSRTRDGYLDSLESGYYAIEEPSPDNCRDYLQYRGMEQSVLDKINEWFPSFSPLDLEILGGFPKMEEISQGRIPVYRSWIELQVLSSAEIEVPHELKSRSEIGHIVRREFFDNRSLEEWIRNKEDSHSVWNYLPYIAYLQKEGTHTSLSYERVIQDNPLLVDLLGMVSGSGDSPHPEISRKHLIPYLSAEHTFREYLAGRYRSLRGDSQSFEFLVEILSYDQERSHGPELVERCLDLTPIATASMICLEGESVAYSSVSHSLSVHPLSQVRISRSAPFYTALFHGLVRYWSLSSDLRFRRTVLDAFTKLNQTNILEGKEDNPEDYIIPLLEIEYNIESIDFSTLITNEPDKTVDLEVRDSLGYSLYYLDHSRVQDALIEISRKRPWLTPWTVRVIDQESLSRILEITSEIPDDRVIYDVINYVTSGFTTVPEEWLKSLHSSALRLESILLWNSLAYFLGSVIKELDDTKFPLVLQVIGCSEVEDKMKFKLISDLRKVRLSQRHVNEVWRSTTQGEIDSKYGIAICLSQELPELSMDDIFEAILESEGLGWLGLLLPEILQERYDEEEVNKRFVQLSLSTVQALKRIGVPPWDEERMSKLVDLWWESNLRKIDDALDLIQALSKKEQEDRLATLDYRETEVLERLAIWLQGARIGVRKRFFQKIIESNIDMTDLSVRKYFYPIYQEIKNREDLDELLVERYPSYLRGMQTLPLSRESWIKHIDEVDREDILEWSWLMEIYIEAGCVTSIDEAIELLDEIVTASGHLIETFDTISQWVLQRSKKDIAAFALYLLRKDTESSRMGYWHRVKKSGVIEALTPVAKNSPEVYARILEMAKEMPVRTIDIRSELQFLFEELSTEDQLNVVRPYIEKFLRKEPFFFKKPLAELLLLHGKKKDVGILIRSLNDEPRPLGDIWLKNMERSKLISKQLTNPLSKLLYEIDMAGGWDEYKKELEKLPEKAKEDLLIFLDNGWIYTGYTYLTSGTVLRDIALKHWKRIFLSDKSPRGEKELFLGDLFQDDNEEILEYIAGEIDRIHRVLKERDKEEPRAYRTPWYSWDVSTLDKIRDRCGYAGLKKLLSRVKEPYAAEGVLTYLFGAAKKEGVPESEILSMQEFQQLNKESKWHLLKEYGMKKNNS